MTWLNRVKEALANKDLTNPSNVFPTFNQNTTGSAAKLTTARKVGGVPFDGTADVLPYDARYLAPSAYLSGNYYYCSSPTDTFTSSGLGNNVVRTSAWLVNAQFTLAALFAEFTAAGAAASLLRLGIWNDNAGVPGTLLLDAGSVSTGTGNAGTVATGGTPGVYAITGLSTVVAPGLYWVGGVLQGATSQPTIRTVGEAVQFPGGPLGTSLPGANDTGGGFGWAGVTGALTTAAGPGEIGVSAPRVGFKVT